MKIIRTGLIALTLCAVGIYGYVTYHYPTYSWHQKLIVTLETPQGTVSGAAVVRVTWEKVIKFLPDMPDARYKVTGEATVIALPDGRHLFALLKGVELTALRAFAAEKMPSERSMSFSAYLSAASEIGRHLGEP